MIALGIGAYFFTNDVEHMVIEPIERMVSLVEKLSQNPLAPIEHSPEGGRNSQYEIRLLEDTLTKITSLVQIGFGEAGSEIIAGNMTEGGAFSPMVSGRKIFAAFGFCDIRKFTDATECLKEDVMLFTNAIGSIVHEACHHFKGAANKNIGDAFLLVWKIPPDNQQMIGKLVAHQPPNHIKKAHTQVLDLS